MEDNQATVTVYDSADRVLYQNTLFGIMREFGDDLQECIEVNQGAAYIRVNALGGAMVFDVEAPKPPA